MRNARHRTVFKRTETDDELRARVIAAIGWRPWVLADAQGEALADAAWLYAKLQRRIVEDVAG